MYKRLKSNFLNPSNEYSPIPFWFWNDDLKEKEIERQINDFYNKGVAGFVIHPRIGVPNYIEYLSDRFMELVKFAVKKAEDLNMQVVLYDEAMYPSGSAHGMVVSGNPEYASQGIVMIECTEEEYKKHKFERIVTVLIADKLTDESMDLKSVSVYKEGMNIGNKKIFVFALQYTGGHIRGIHFGEDDGEEFRLSSADLLNSKAVEKFINLTHERYYEVLSEYFGNTIIAIFTDEPSIMGRGVSNDFRPWTNDFTEFYISEGGSLLDLPALWFDVGQETNIIRRKYDEAVQKRMEQTYYKPINSWCEAHNIGLMGHPSHSADIGLLKYFHIPGQDLIFRKVAPEGELSISGIESTQAKCSSDAARHYGMRRNSNECFACGGKNGVEWSFTADDMKWMMDWLFVRGVNMLVPHAFYYSINGERRIGERPPDVGPNNIWWEHYGLFSDYIKRMCYMLTDSVNTAKTAILCEKNFLPYKIAKVLFTNQIEFNYLEKSLLLKDSIIENGKIIIKNQCYTNLVIEDKSMITPEVRMMLDSFVEGGGKVFMLSRNEEFDYISINDPEYVLNLLKPDLLIFPHNKDLRMSSIIKDGIHFYILTNEGEEEVSGKIYLNGDVEEWNPWTGEIRKADLNNFSLPRRESAILCMSRKEKEIDLDKWYVKNKLVSLTSWTNWEGLENFSGSMEYETFVVIEDARNVKLDLGEVYEIAKVYVNDNEVGVKMWAPYVFNISDFVNYGQNHIKVKVTNTLANKISKAKISSGLCGGTKLIIS